MENNNDNTADSVARNGDLIRLRTTPENLKAKRKNEGKQPQNQECVEELTCSVKQCIIHLHEHRVVLNLVGKLHGKLLHVVTECRKLELVEWFLCSVVPDLVEEIHRLEVQDGVLHWDGFLVVVYFFLLVLQHVRTKVFLVL